MIHFCLACARAHRFDAWFRSNEDYEQQRRNGLVVCPVCGTDEVEKALMTPALAGTGKKKNEDDAATDRRAARMPDISEGRTGGVPDIFSEKERAFLARWQQMARHVRDHADYVGREFAEEARKIHFGEVKPRAIYGEAHREDVVSLLDEGIELVPLPPLPEKQN